jgi:hypothetical protein
VSQTPANCPAGRDSCKSNNDNGLTLTVPSVSSVPDVLQKLTALGLSVEVDGDQLLVGPVAKITDEVRALVKAHRDQIMAAVRDAKMLEALDREVLARPPPLASVGWVVVPEPRRRASGSAGRSDQRAGGPPSSPAATTGMFGAGS